MASVDEWRVRHPGLHPDDVLLGALRARWDELALEREPWLWRWLGGPNSQEFSLSLMLWAGAGAVNPSTRAAAQSRLDKKWVPAIMGQLVAKVLNEVIAGKAWPPQGNLALQRRLAGKPV